MISNRLLDKRDPENNSHDKADDLFNKNLDKNKENVKDLFDEIVNLDDESDSKILKKKSNIEFSDKSVSKSEDESGHFINKAYGEVLDDMKPNLLDMRKPLSEQETKELILEKYNPDGFKKYLDSGKDEAVLDIQLSKAIRKAHKMGEIWAHKLTRPKVDYPKSEFDEDEEEDISIGGYKKLEELKYWDLYPLQVKKWLIYTKSKKGHYDEEGKWVEGYRHVRAAPTSWGATFEFPIAEEITTEDIEFVKNREREYLLAKEELEKYEDEGSGSLSSRFKHIGIDPPKVAYKKELQTKVSNDPDWEYWERKYEEEQQKLPEDLRYQFRFGIQPEEIEHCHPKLKRVFSFINAPLREVHSFRKRKIAEKWGKHETDTGSDAIQIAVLTLRINHLTRVLRKHVTDSHNKHRLQRLIRRRKALMKHMKKKDLYTYYSLLKDMNIRDQVELWTASKK